MDPDLVDWDWTFRVDFRSSRSEVVSPGTTTSDYDQGEVGE